MLDRVGAAISDNQTIKSSPQKAIKKRADAYMPHADICHQALKASAPTRREGFLAKLCTQLRPDEGMIPRFLGDRFAEVGR